ncbi:MAG: Crp/Fnr family transcriptional regulator [Saprospiraceae bacterium]|nr:Crp/Fnr family transcriptional regulator [Saprospiraceae bacterium]
MAHHLNTHDPSKNKSPEQEIIDYISKFAPLTQAEIQDIIDSLNIRIYKKGDFLLKEGQVSDLCFFVLKGCVRQYYLIDGEEKTTNFFTEGDPITAYEGTFKRLPSKFYLACVEDCILTAGTQKAQEELFQKNPKFELICRIAMEDELGKSQTKLASFMTNSPEERYLHLLDTKPELLERVPQYQLASYLGIKPESLSRIRKRIMGR